MRRLALDAGQQLPLVDEVDVAAQRRRRPGVLRDAEAIVRLRRSRHAHLAGRLRAIDGGNALLGEQPTPGAVGDDHQLGDELVERAAALPFADDDAAILGVGEIAFDREVVVVVALHRRGLAAPAFAGVGQIPEHFQLVAEGEVGKTFDHGLLVEPGLDVVVTQVGDDRHDFDARLVRGDLELGRHRQIQRYGRAVATRSQREAFDRRVGQHGDFVARHVDRRQPVTRDRVERRTWDDSDTGRRNMYPDAPADARQRLQ